MWLWWFFVDFSEGSGWSESGFKVTNYFPVSSTYIFTSSCTCLTKSGVLMFRIWMFAIAIYINQHEMSLLHHLYRIVLVWNLYCQILELLLLDDFQSCLPRIHFSFFKPKVVSVFASEFHCLYATIIRFWFLILSIHMDHLIRKLWSFRFTIE